MLSILVLYINITTNIRLDQVAIKLKPHTIKSFEDFITNDLLPGISKSCNFVQLPSD